MWSVWMINYIFKLLINSEEGVNEVYFYQENPIFVRTISCFMRTSKMVPAWSVHCVFMGWLFTVCTGVWSIYTCWHKNTLSITTLKNSQKISWDRPVVNKLWFALNIKYGVFHLANMLSYNCTIHYCTYYKNNLCFHILQACSFIFFLCIKKVMLYLIFYKNSNPWEQFFTGARCLQTKPIFMKFCIPQF